ncbi:MAG: AMP-binding protein [Aquamicrobium sp.]|uniref:AMP-binding protein n=1 Tax=Aquamicrobium sp. TaxID=1872579 RepID=UPI00349E94CA|nr:AMP-binding protein [Aquamicrobium sp.]MCO5158578.1 AMP-binding protein [Aquamicrobium sp.]
MEAGVPAPEDCVLRYLLERHARTIPERIFAVVDRQNGAPEAWTYADMLERVRRTAAALAAAGVGKGSNVLCLTRAPETSVTVWFALNHLGAAYVPINHQYHGALLERLVHGASAAAIVVDPEFLPQLEAIDHAPIRTVIATAAPPEPSPGLRCLVLDDLLSTRGGDAVADPGLKPWDLQSVMFTSGTTGPSKGVLSSYVHLHTVVDEPFSFLDREDRYLCNLPLFHVGGMLQVYSMLLRGGSIALSAPFRTADFWPAVNRTGSSMATLLSGMASLLMKQAVLPGERETTLRKTIILPFSEDAAPFGGRFGVDVYTMYHMTEICVPLVSAKDPLASALCGKPRRGVSVRLVDEHDCEVPPGQAGQLVVRCDRPWAMSHGYLDNPAATAAAWLNGWFHTGDMFRQDADGDFYFIDRAKDVIRRRGENISSFELENEYRNHPDVLDVAAIAVADAHGEDEVLVVVEPVPGTAPVPADLARYGEERLPRFMVPRYIHVMEKLPRTPTGKIEKHQIRSGLSQARLWDRTPGGKRPS